MLTIILNGFISNERRTKKAKQSSKTHTGDASQLFTLTSGKKLFNNLQQWGTHEKKEFGPFVKIYFLKSQFMGIFTEEKWEKENETSQIILETERSSSYFSHLSLG